MTVKRLLTLFALLLVLASSLAVVTPAAAQSDSASSSRAAVEFCRQLDETGQLDEVGLTFGECVNLFAGQVDGNQSRFLAGICGAEIAQAQFETTSKGQCIKAANEFLGQE